MPKITLPDGDVRNFDQPTTPHAVAAAIGPGLAKAALAAKVNGELVDTSFLIEHDVELDIVTSKSDEALELIRHDAACSSESPQGSCRDRLLQLQLC